MGDDAFDYSSACYFGTIGGFPGKKSVVRVEDWDGGDRISIFCTQLSYTEYSNEEKAIRKGWLRLLSERPHSFTALHFTSKVNQEFLDAACRQTDLEELRLKWGSYKDLSAVCSLTKLRHLYIGSGASVEDIEPLARLGNLEVLYLENFKKIRNCSVLARLTHLKQLSISGSIWNTAIVDDIEFLKHMSGLVSVVFRNVRISSYRDAPEGSMERDYPSIRFL